MSVATYSNDWRTLQRFAYIFPKNYSIAVALGTGYYDDSNYTNALKFFKKAIKLNPQAKLDWGKVGYSFEEGERNYPEAIRYFERAIEEKNGQHDTWLMQRLGWCCIQDKQYEKALDVLLEHCHHAPTDSWGQGKIGYCYQMLENYETALQYHLKADQIGSTENAWNLGNIGYCYQMLNDYASALEYHKRSEQVDSSDFWNLKNVGYCSQKTGDYATALTYHLRVYEEDPSDIWNVKNVGYCHQQHSNYEKALKYHYLVEKMVPNDTWNLGHIGYCLQRIDKHKDAIPYHQKVYDLAPDDIWNKYQLGYCLFTEGGWEDAEYFLQGDDDKYALLHLGSIYLIKNEYYKAFEAYKSSLELFGSITSFLDVFNKDRAYLENDYGVPTSRCDDMLQALENHSMNMNDWDSKE